MAISGRAVGRGCRGVDDALVAALDRGAIGGEVKRSHLGGQRYPRER